nr:hypothetical protein [Candidatus Omnitrophota bacterium]
MSAARQYSVKKVAKTDFEVYLKKAKEFYQTMYQAEKAENWNAVGLNGVHCVISLIDGILVKYSGVCSVGKDHMAAVDLLTTSLNIDDISQKSQTARRVIAKKNLVEYEARPFIKSEAIDMIKQIQRFYDWAIDKL